MKKIKYIIILLLLLIPINVYAEDKYNIYLFYNDGCPHCEEESEFLNEYLSDKDNINLITYEVSGNKDNQVLIQKVQKKLDTNFLGVPVLLISNKSLVGYNPTTKNTIINYIENIDKKYIDVIDKINNDEDIEVEDDDDLEINVPILGKVKASNVSLPLLSIILGLTDGFNPCAMWILIFLISMLFNMKNRKKMWILGITFILTSGLVYFLFMMTYLNFANFINKIVYFKLIIAGVSFVIGFINIYNFIKSLKKDDGCEVVKKDDRKKIMNRIIKITSEKSFVIALLGIIVLAVSVNMIEMMCSIGIPVLFTQILSLNKLPFIVYLLYMLIYIFFFLVDDIGVFVISMLTLKVTGISTKFTKYSHLVTGIITLLIGILILVKPSLLMLNF